MPISRQARITRRAISPRFAIRTFLNIKSRSLALLGMTPSQRDVPVLLGRVLVPLVTQRLERVDQAGASVARIDDVDHIAAGSRHVWIRELLRVLVHLLVHRRLR